MKLILPKTMLLDAAMAWSASGFDEAAKCIAAIAGFATPVFLRNLMKRPQTVTD
ncbi:MAG: hypothetical protein AAGF25_02750 [Pseudomonadota bacterium]